eukprot:TRINITY_DN19523_c0_g1_i2.p1 TRINITY_DN19523_c0_g1~~TRINITY_DN19523_c0_g1_i2.p1  ORF type:complete len:411 (+),score=31.84 TRINITY_DN19523_c0_g1_i2:90-1322(+)
MRRFSFVFVFAFVLACVPCASALNSSSDPDIHYDMLQIVREHGYPIEPHYITTKDGYILNAFRIPHGVAESEHVRAKPVVLLQHALLCSSFDWVNMAPSQSLGFMLADAGFDVWFGNNRGNAYSMNHSHFPVDSDRFWNFTYDEMALYDLPASIEYVLSATGSASLSYVGHSQGTLQAFAGFSLNEVLSTKIDLFVALAPVAYAHNMRSPVFEALSLLRAARIYEFFGMRKLLPNDGSGDGFLNRIAKLLCDPLDRLCNAAIFLFCGRTTHINATRLPVFLAHTPAGTSVKNMDHWSQGVLHNVFQMYDYGSAERNIAAYGQSTPPAYNLRNFRVKTALFTGGHDILADRKDVQYILDAVPDRTVVYTKNLPDYGHLDFAWGQDANLDVYTDVIRLLKNHSRIVTPTIAI